MLLLDLCSQPYFTCLTWSVYTYLLEFLEVGPWWDKIANFNFMTIEPLVITCTAALRALSFPIGTAAIDQQFTLWVMDIHCLNQLLLEHVITWGQVLFWNECFRNLRMSFLAAFENLCLFDDAKKVALNVLLLMAVPSQTGCSPAEISPSLESPAWFLLSETISLLESSWSASELVEVLSSTWDAVFTSSSLPSEPAWHVKQTNVQPK